MELIKKLSFPKLKLTKQDFEKIQHDCELRDEVSKFIYSFFENLQQIQIVPMF